MHGCLARVPCTGAPGLAPAVCDLRLRCSPSRCSPSPPPSRSSRRPGPSCPRTPRRRSCAPWTSTTGPRCTTPRCPAGCPLSQRRVAHEFRVCLSAFRSIQFDAGLRARARSAAPPPRRRGTSPRSGSCCSPGRARTPPPGTRTPGTPPRRRPRTTTPPSRAAIGTSCSLGSIHRGPAPG